MTVFSGVPWCSINLAFRTRNISGPILLLCAVSTPADCHKAGRKGGGARFLSCQLIVWIFVLQLISFWLLWAVSPISAHFSCGSSSLTRPLALGPADPSCCLLFLPPLLPAAPLPAAPTSGRLHLSWGVTAPSSYPLLALGVCL